MSAALSRNATGFILSRGTAILGDQVTAFFVPVTVFGATRSTTASGYAFLIQWLPRIISMPLSGALVDRYPPRVQLVAIDLMRAALLLVAAFSDSIVVLVIVSGAATLFNGHSTVAVESVLGRAIRQDEFPIVQSRFQSAQQLATILGPAVGAVLTTHLPVALGTTVIAFVFAGSALFTVRTTPSVAVFGRPSAGGGIVCRLRRGFRVVFSSRALMSLVAVTVCINLTGSLALAALPSIVEGSLDGSDGTVALLASAAAGASLLTAVSCGLLTKRWSVDRLLIPALGLLAISAALMASARNVAAMGTGYAGWSAGVTAYAVWMRTWRVRLIPQNALGSALGVFSSLIMVTAPVSGLLLALVGGVFGPQGAVGFVACASVLLLVPSLWAYNRFAPPRASEPSIDD